jgi:hypothetical protein
MLVTVPMLPLDQVIAGAEVRGLAGATPVEVLCTEWIGSDALNVVYRGADGPAEVLLFATPSRGLSLSRRPEPLDSYLEDHSQEQFNNGARCHAAASTSTIL